MLLNRRIDVATPHLRRTVQVPPGWPRWKPATSRMSGPVRPSHACDQPDPMRRSKFFTGHSGKTVLRCLVWVETCSCGEPQVELSSEQVSHGASCRILNVAPI